MTNKFQDVDSFRKYLELFEREVMLKYYQMVKDKASARKNAIPDIQIVSIRENSKLKEFQDIIGKSFESEDVMAFNFYGCYKISSYIIRRIKGVSNIFPNIRVIRSPVVFFNSISPLFVKEIAPSLSKDFTAFKDEIVRLRWGEK